MPVAAKIALPTAGARPTIGVSPAPAEGRSLRSRRTTSIGGHVAEARHAVVREAGVHDPAVRRTRSPRRARRRSPARSAPSTWLRRPSGLTIAPHSNALDDAARCAPAGLRDRPRSRRRSRRSRPSRCRRRCRSRGPGAALARPQPNLSAAASKHGREARVGEVLQPERERVHAERVRQLVHVRLAREVVRRGGEPAVRALPQRRARRDGTGSSGSGRRRASRSPAGPEL